MDNQVYYADRGRTSRQGGNPRILSASKKRKGVGWGGVVMQGSRRVEAERERLQTAPFTSLVTTVSMC